MLYHDAPRTGMVERMQAMQERWTSGYLWARRDWCAVGFLACVAVGVYANSLSNDFVYDDHAVVVGDQRSHRLSRIGSLFAGPYWTVTKRTLYRPVTLLSFALNHAVTGLSAPGYRAVNLALHALVCISLYRLMTLLFGDFRSAVVAGAVYAVHPIHVEAVVPIVGRSELLGGLAVVLAMVLYVGDAARGGRGLTWRYVGVVALAWAGMLSKESAIVVVGLVVAFDVWRRLCVPAERRERGWESYLTSRFLWRYTGLLAAVIVVMTMRRWALGMVLGEGVTFPMVDNPLAYESWLPRLLTGLVLFGKYIHLLITGYPLSCDYSPQAIPVARSLSVPVAWGLACLAGSFVCAGVSLRRRKTMAAAIGWFLISYAPAANVLVLIGTTFAERLMYLPSVGVAMIWGLVVPAVASRLWRRGSKTYRALSIPWVAAVAAVWVAYVVLATQRNRVWRTDEALFRDGLAKQPASARCQYNIGAWYASHGRLDEGMKHLRKAIEIVSSYYLARTKLAACYFHLERWEDVVGVLEPLVSTTASRSEHLVAPLYMMGRARMEMGQFADALSCFDKITQITPRLASAKQGQAEVKADPRAGPLCDRSEAWMLIQEAVNLDPEDASILLAAARIGARQGRLREAQLYLNQAAGVLDDRTEEMKGVRRDTLKLSALEKMKREHGEIQSELHRQFDALRTRFPLSGSQPASSQSAGDSDAGASSKPEGATTSVSRSGVK